MLRVLNQGDFGKYIQKWGCLEDAGARLGVVPVADDVVERLGHEVETAQSDAYIVMDYVVMAYVVVPI